MDDDFIIVKRSRPASSVSYNYPAIRLEFPSGRFLLNKLAVEALKAEQGDGIMFIFNRKEKTAYVVKDDEPDAFIIRQKLSESCYRFCSKDLAGHFASVFRLEQSERQSIIFTVETRPNEKGWHAIKSYTHGL
jgi:hypothetical protein